jgi:hypothetical protein
MGVTGAGVVLDFATLRCTTTLYLRFAGIPQVYIYLKFVQFQLQFHFDKAHSAHNEVHVSS